MLKRNRDWSHSLPLFLEAVSQGNISTLCSVARVLMVAPKRHSVRYMQEGTLNDRLGPGNF